MRLTKFLCVLAMSAPLHAAEMSVTDSPGTNDFVLAGSGMAAAIVIETNDEPAAAALAAFEAPRVHQKPQGSSRDIEQRRHNPGREADTHSGWMLASR